MPILGMAAPAMGTVLGGAGGTALAGGTAATAAAGGAGSMMGPLMGAMGGALGTALTQKGTPAPPMEMAFPAASSQMQPQQRPQMQMLPNYGMSASKMDPALAAAIEELLMRK